MFTKVIQMEKNISIPEGIKVSVAGTKVSVSGKNGNQEKDFASPLFAGVLKIEADGKVFKVSTAETKRKIKSEVGTVASLVQNMIEGCQKNYTAKLKVIFMHFPITVKVSGAEVVITNFLGERKARSAKILVGCKVEAKGDEIFISGNKKEDVGQTCANIERATWIKARDRRVYQDGIFTVEKSW